MPGDQARLHQILANLLANARTHTPPGIRRDPGATEGTIVRVAVTDDGPGVPDTLQPTCSSGSPAATTPRRRANGPTGLGLSIVAAVGQAHGGRVEVSRCGSDDFSGAPPRPMASSMLLARERNVARSTMSALDAMGGRPR